MNLADSNVFDDIMSGVGYIIHPFIMMVLCFIALIISIGVWIYQAKEDNRYSGYGHRRDPKIHIIGLIAVVLFIGLGIWQGRTFLQRVGEELHSVTTPVQTTPGTTSGTELPPGS